MKYHFWAAELRPQNNQIRILLKWTFTITLFSNRKRTYNTLANWIVTLDYLLFRNFANALASAVSNVIWKPPGYFDVNCNSICDLYNVIECALKALIFPTDCYECYCINRTLHSVKNLALTADYNKHLVRCPRGQPAKSEIMFVFSLWTLDLSVFSQKQVQCSRDDAQLLQTPFGLGTFPS